MLTQKFRFFETTFSLTILLNLKQYLTAKKKKKKKKKGLAIVKTLLRLRPSNCTKHLDPFLQILHQLFPERHWNFLQFHF